MSRLRVAEVGIRGKGGQHMEILSGFEEVELVAVCDTVPEILESVGDKFGISRRYSSIDQLLDGEELDAVFIATPPEINAPVALPCLEHGVNTFLEKPPGMTAAEAKGLVVAAEKSGAKGMVGLNRRFHPMLTQALEMVEERGPVIQLVGEFHKPMSVLSQMSRFSPEVMDNWLVANDIHVVDMVRRMAGAEVREVHSFARRAVSEYRDVHAALWCSKTTALPATVSTILRRRGSSATRSTATRSRPTSRVSARVLCCAATNASTCRSQRPAAQRRRFGISSTAC